MNELLLYAYLAVINRKHIITIIKLWSVVYGWLNFFKLPKNKNNNYEENWSVFTF